MNQQTHMINFTIKTYQRLLILYPQQFRNQFGEEMLQVFKTKSNITYANKGKWGLFRFQLSALLDLMTSTVREHFSMGSVIKTFKSKSILYILMMFALSGTFYYTYTHWEKMPYPFPAPRNVINSTHWGRIRVENGETEYHASREFEYRHTAYMFLRSHESLKDLKEPITAGRLIDRKNYTKFSPYITHGASLVHGTATAADSYYIASQPVNAWQAWTPLYTALFPMLWALYILIFDSSRQHAFWQKFSNMLMLIGSLGLGGLQYFVLYKGVLEPLWLWFSYSTILICIGLIFTGILALKQHYYSFGNLFPFILAGLLLAQDFLRYNISMDIAQWTQILVVIFTLTNILWTAWGIATLRQADEVHIKQVLVA